MDQFLSLQNQHQLEQGIAGLKQLAGILGAYYTELRANGFTDDQAFALTLNFQTVSMQQHRNDSGGA